MNFGSEAHPFLRWAGGKKWLQPTLKSFVNIDDYSGYHEPFLGGGVTFFCLNPKCETCLSDVNEELINSYSCVKKHPNLICDRLSLLEVNEQEYYRIRAEKYTSNIDRAVRFIYLNQTSFNGIYRVNKKGQYNVPYGKRENVTFDFANIRATSKRLQNSNISVGDFSRCIDNVKKGDLVFLDPPYVVSKDENCFIAYNQHLFSLEDQERLSRLIDKIKERKAFYILTNAYHPTIKDIFEKGDITLELNRKSLIGGRNAYRGKTIEYLFTNIESAEKIKPK